MDYVSELEKLIQTLDRLDDHPHFTRDQQTNLRRAGDYIQATFDVECEKDPADIDEDIKNAFRSINPYQWIDYSLEIVRHPRDFFLIVTVLVKPDSGDAYKMMVEEASNMEAHLNRMLHTHDTFVTADNYTIVIRKMDHASKR